MPRRFLMYVPDFVLLGAAAVAFLTGLLADRLDLHQFVPRQWAGYALAALVVVHLVVHWRLFLAPFARHGRAPAAAPRDDAAGAAPAAVDPHAMTPARVREFSGTAANGGGRQFGVRPRCHRTGPASSGTPARWPSGTAPAE
jgi:hypothetical protein